MSNHLRLTASILLVAVLTGCASGGGTPSAPSSNPASARVEGQPAPRTPRTLVTAIHVEPPSLVNRTPLRVGAGQAQFLVLAMFEAGLGQLDEQDRAQPLLAEAFPQLDTDSWKVFPDGRMETTWKLKPNLTWHDGTPLSAEDWSFAWQVFSTQQLGLSTAAPFQQIEGVTAPDARTISITWKVPYYDAGSLTAYGGTFPPLPRHLLQQSFDRGDAEAFANLPYWNQEFIGLGPYKLDRWNPGVAIEASAFDKFVRGRPKIDRIEVRFIGDANTALSNLRSGTIQLAGDTAVGVPQSVDIKREWEPSKAGTVILVPSQWRSVRFQFRPEFADPAAVLDPRVRKALAHAVDKQVIVDTLYSGLELTADSFVAPKSIHGPAVERAITKFPYDLRRTEQLMGEAGFTKRDGFYTNVQGNRLNFEVKINASPEFEAERTVIASGWRDAGFEIQEVSNPAALSQDPRVRNEYRSIYVNSTTVTTDALTPNFVNNGNFADPEFDRLSSLLQVTLLPQQRQEIMVQLVGVYSEILPAISLRFASHPWAYTSNFSGFQIGGTESSLGWSVLNWDLK
jgi:ABC-type transport system substrate-binding protein